MSEKECMLGNRLVWVLIQTGIGTWPGLLPLYVFPFEKTRLSAHAGHTLEGSVSVRDAVPEGVRAT